MREKHKSIMNALCPTFGPPMDPREGTEPRFFFTPVDSPIHTSAKDCLTRQQPRSQSLIEQTTVKSLNIRHHANVNEMAKKMRKDERRHHIFLVRVPANTSEPDARTSGVQPSRQKNWRRGSGYLRGGELGS